MKIYHTETQADYDALMVELEAQGIETLSKEYWPTFKTETTVVVRAQSGEKRNCENGTTYGNLSRVRSRYDTPITKYKAKVDDRMRFTKENVYKMVERYSVDQGYLLGDLKSDISKLDDTPEKVVVPKFVAEFYEECENATLEFLITQLEATYSRSELGKWYSSCSGRHRNGKANAQEVIAKMKLYGYEVEKEPLYYIPLPHLETSDGIQQVLSQRKNGTNYFASRPNDNIKQRFTKEEIAQVPEIYKSYATLIEEEEE